jgi:hypothetical protein
MLFPSDGAGAVPEQGGKPVKGGPWHAHFSEKAAELYGSSIYVDAAGAEVELTCAAHEREWADKEYLWPDKEYRGVVVDYVRHGRQGLWEDLDRGWMR